jgi:hypothetical protein
MPPSLTRYKIKKIKDSQSSEGNEIETKEKNETTDKAVTYDKTKAGIASDEIIDILDTPDVAMWSKGINKKTNTLADKVQNRLVLNRLLSTVLSNAKRSRNKLIYERQWTCQ